MDNGPSVPGYEITAEERKHILTEMGKRFTAQDLLGYIEDDEQKVPFEEVIANVEAIFAKSNSRSASA